MFPGLTVPSDDGESSGTGAYDSVVTSGDDDEASDVYVYSVW